MKNLTPLLLLIFLLPLLSCDELNDLADGKFDLVRTEVFEFNIASDSSPDPEDDVEVSSTQTYNMAFDQGFTELVGTDLSAVEKVKVLEVSYEFQNFSGNVDALVTSIITFSGPVKHTSESIKMSEAVILRELFKIEADFEPMNSWTAANKFFGVEYHAVSTGNPVNFRVKITVKFEVTVNAEDQ